jgi:hypothetical protein
MRTSAASAMRILTIKWRTNGSRLPSAEEVLIIRPTGKTVKAPLCSGTTASRRPARKLGIPKQDRDTNRSGWNAVAAKVEKNTFPERAISQRFKEPD